MAPTVRANPWILSAGSRRASAVNHESSASSRQREDAERFNRASHNRMTATLKPLISGITSDQNYLLNYLRHRAIRRVELNNCSAVRSRVKTGLPHMCRVSSDGMPMIGLIRLAIMAFTAPAHGLANNWNYSHAKSEVKTVQSILASSDESRSLWTPE